MASLKLSSPFMDNSGREGYSFKDKEYISYREKESVSKDFDPDYPDEFTIVKDIVVDERVPIKEEINSHRSKVGLKNLLAGIVDSRQMKALIDKTKAAPGYFDYTKLPDSHLAMEELAGSIDKVWSEIPAELKGDLSKEEFVKVINSEKLKQYVLSVVEKQQKDKEKEGE